VPYVKGGGLWFDHHSSETERVWADFQGCSRLAPSCARVVFDYYGGAERFPTRVEMVEYADRIDSAHLTIEEILRPSGWVLLGFLTDPRSGLGRFHDYTISNYQLMDKLLHSYYQADCQTILTLPDMQERIVRYFDEDARFREMLQQYTRRDKNVLITDLRNVETVRVGNRFLIYSLYPEANVSLWLAGARDQDTVMISCGHSILNRTCKTDVGSLMLQYYGGGHFQVGTCQVPSEEADSILEEIIQKLHSDDEGVA